MHHFESHVRSEVQRQADEAKAKFDAALIRLDNDTVAQARGPLLDALHDTEPELHAVIDAYLKVGEQRMTALRTDPAAVATLGPLPDSPSDQLERWAQKRRQHAMTLENMSDVEQEKAIRAELGELEGRQQLGERLPEVQRWVASLARIERLRVAHSELHTGKVTRKQSELSKTAVTDALDSRLDHELAALRCDHIPLDPRFRGSAGSTVVNLELVGARSAPELRAVLSEGEQRAVALAFFFAEVACAEHDGGIVLDDPVSSLDDERREYIARRLVEEAARRQVIVFTHDLPFMLDLVQQAEQANIDQSQQAVWRDQRVAGLVDNQPPFDAMNLRQRVAALTIEVQEWDKQSRPANQDDAWRRVCDVYRRMRTAWERAVEERLLAGVVQRFQRPVHTQKLDKVQITEELLKAVNDGMDRCSQYVHDAPVGARGGLPSRQQIAADLEPLRTFEKDSRL
jgi:recombinational DNA repair ATPase RecF